MGWDIPVGHTLWWLNTGYCMFISSHVLTSTLRLWCNIARLRQLMNFNGVSSLFEQVFDGLSFITR